MILGVTKYYGHDDQQELEPAQELVYLKNFRTRNRLPYGFAVSGSNKNEFNYGVVNSRRLTAEFDHLIDSPGKADLVKHPACNKISKEVSRK